MRSQRRSEYLTAGSVRILLIKKWREVTRKKGTAKARKTCVRRSAASVEGARWIITTPKAAMNLMMSTERFLWDSSAFLLTQSTPTGSLLVCMGRWLVSGARTGF